MLAMTQDRNQIEHTALAQMAALDAKKLRHIQDAINAKRNYHLVQIGHSAFKFASHHLQQAGYELYSPQMRNMVIPRSNQLTSSARKNRHLLGKERLTPLFGSYRFIRFDVNVDPWRDIFNLVGVYGIGCANNMPVPMPDSVIAKIKAAEIDGAIPGSTPVKALIFKVGDVARVNTGPFISFEGAIERIDESGRIRLLLDIFNSLTPVDVSADELDKVSK